MAVKNGRWKWAGLAREGWKFVLPGLLVALLVGIWWGAQPGFWLVIITAAMAAFFRDPDRVAPGDPKAVLAPGDGKVVGVDEVEVYHPEKGNVSLRRISIFLSVFDVHVQRSPVAGRVLSVRYEPGAFFHAATDKASDQNEHAMIWLDCAGHPFGVRQIAGWVARRVVTYCRKEETLARGERLGLIRFGSRVELYLPLEAKVEAVIGEYVKGGQTVMALMGEDVTS